MSVEALENLKRKVSFNIKKADVTASVKDELKKYAKKAKVAGFRPGKVPANVLEQMYGGNAYEDALNTHMQKSFSEVVKNNNLNLASNPDFDLANTTDEEYVFSATFEVMPTITISPLANIKVEKPTTTVSEDDVEQTIISIRKQKATFSESSAPAADGDKVTIDFKGTIDGVEFNGGSATDYPFVLGKGSMLPEFEKAVLGLNDGETKVAMVNFPNDYHAKEFQGKTAEFTITLKKHEASVLPELSSEFIKEIGVKDGTVEALYKEVRDNINHEVNRRLKAKLRDNTLSSLLAINPIDAPWSLVHDEIHHMMDRTEEQMKQYNYPKDQIKLSHDMFKDDATRMVKLRLLVQELIKEQAITVDNDDIKKTITANAAMYDDPEKYLEWYLSDQSRASTARAMAIEEKVIDTILASASVTETSVTYQNLMQERI